MNDTCFQACWQILILTRMQIYSGLCQKSLIFKLWKYRDRQVLAKLILLSHFQKKKIKTNYKLGKGLIVLFWFEEVCIEAFRISLWGLGGCASFWCYDHIRFSHWGDMFFCQEEIIDHIYGFWYRTLLKKSQRSNTVNKQRIIEDYNIWYQCFANYILLV